MDQPDYKTLLWDTAGKPYWKTASGGKLYVAPASAMTMYDDPRAIAWAKQQGYEVKGGRAGLAAASQGTVGPDGRVSYADNPVTTGDQGHGLWGTTGEWNGQTGQFDSSFDWGNLFTMLVAAGVTAGAASAIASGVAAGDAASTAAATQALGTGTGTGVGLGETAATTGLTSGAGLPGAAAIPTVGDLATASSAIPGVTGSTTSTIGNTLSNPSTIGKISDLLGVGAAGVGAATQSTGQTQQANVSTGLTANAQNINGQNAFEQQLIARAKDEEAQRSTALKNVYRNSIATNPRVSPYNPAGAPVYSPEYLSTLGGLSGQGAKTLSTPGQYDTSKLPALKPYTPYDPNSMSGPGGTQPSTMQTVGNWLAPTLSTISAIAKILGH